MKLNKDLKNKIDSIPASPGVYLMYSKDYQILYVGKAKNLKKRVSQYFDSQDKPTRTQALVSRIFDIEYIITNNEIEALILENNLIKTKQPPYNILLKDDKNYAYIQIDLSNSYPTINKVRKIKKDAFLYFGPYMQDAPIKNILDIITFAFPVRTCKLKIDKVKKNFRPCLNYHIGNCLAPCIGEISKDEYSKIINEIIAFLRGDDKIVREKLTSKMLSCSESQNFEKAMQYKEQLENLDNIVRKQVVEAVDDFNIDAFAIVKKDEYYAINILFVRGGRIIGSDNYFFEHVQSDEAGVLENFILQFYYNMSYIPLKIVTNIKKLANNALKNYFSQQYSQKIVFEFPQRGIKKQIVDMAFKNASNLLEKEIRNSKNQNKMPILENIMKLLSLKKLPLRIECFDNSHISGSNMVTAMVVFTNGKPDYKQYRRFKGQRAHQNDDYQVMYESIKRRFLARESQKEAFINKPDLIIVDGGLGQLKYAQKALKELYIGDIEIIAIAEKEEIIYKVDGTKILLDMDSNELKLIQNIRDEAHRFAITYHRRLRENNQTLSMFEVIPGIGKVKIKKLFEKFGSIEAIASASVEEIAETPSINKNDVINLKQFLDNKNNLKKS